MSCLQLPPLILDKARVIEAVNELSGEHIPLLTDTGGVDAWSKKHREAS
jgi:hypothetical protein